MTSGSLWYSPSQIAPSIYQIFLSLPLARSAATFARRGSVITAEPLVGLSDEFANNHFKQTMWNSFLKKNRLPEKSFQEVVKILRQKLQPILTAAQN